MPLKQIGVAIGNVIRSRANEAELKTTKLLLGFDWFREMYEATEEFYSIICGTDSSMLIRWMKNIGKQGSALLRLL